MYSKCARQEIFSKLKIKSKTKKKKGKKIAFTVNMTETCKNMS